MTDEEKIDLGKRAKGVLENPLVTDALESMRQALVGQFFDCPVRDREALEEIHRMNKTLEAFVNHFEKIVAQGESAAAVLKKHIYDSERKVA